MLLLIAILAVAAVAAFLILRKKDPALVAKVEADAKAVSAAVADEVKKL